MNLGKDIDGALEKYIDHFLCREFHAGEFAGMPRPKYKKSVMPLLYDTKYQMQSQGGRLTKLATFYCVSYASAKLGVLKVLRLEHFDNAS